MARTGPQKIPGALLDLFFGGGRYGGSDMESNCGVLHTTEGATLVSYDSGAVAPNVTGVPDFAARRLVWHQHFDVDESARALVNAPGGVQTNQANAFQVELVGTCDPATHARWTSQGVQHIYWPDPPDWAVRDLAWLMRWLRDQHGIPLSGASEWMAYPASYGGTAVRMSFAQWNAFKGWCGHQHVPENQHGDPGNIPFARILAAATGAAAPTTPSEEDFMTDAQYRDVMSGLGQLRDMIAGTPERVWNADLPRVDGAWVQDPARPTVPALWLLAGIAPAQYQLAALQAQLSAQAAVLKTVLDGHDGVDTEAVLAAIHDVGAQAAAAVQTALAAGVDVNVAVGNTTTKEN